MKNTLTGTRVAGAFIFTLISGACSTQRQGTVESESHARLTASDSTSAVSVTTLSELLRAGQSVVVENPAITVTTPSGHVVNLTAERLTHIAEITHQVEAKDSSTTIHLATDTAYIETRNREVTKSKTSVSALTYSHLTIIAFIVVAALWACRRIGR